VDGKSVSVSADLQREILGKKIGQSVELEVWRKGRTLRVNVQTGEQPDKFVRASMRPPGKNSRPAPVPKANGGEHPVGPGLTVSDATPALLEEMKIQRKSSGGVLVTEVAPLSPAAAAGVERGDIITEAGGRPIHSKKDFETILGGMNNDRGILLLLERGGQKTFAILKP
jgi:serine protease Do